MAQVNLQFTSFLEKKREITKDILSEHSCTFGWGNKWDQFKSFLLYLFSFHNFILFEKWFQIIDLFILLRAKSVLCVWNKTLEVNNLTKIYPRSLIMIKKIILFFSIPSLILTFSINLFVCESICTERSFDNAKGVLIVIGEHSKIDHLIIFP